MSERKVLNKYYPPDFDPSKIPRMKLSRNRQYTVRLMAPFNMRCVTCGEYIYKGKKFNARKEDVENQDYLGIRIYRFYIKCTRCLQEISFKTDPKNTDYEIEAGATRNFMALKLAEEQAKREEDELKEEEANNPMKLLENRTEQSRNEIELLESLEELKDLNRRQAAIDYDGMLQQFASETAEDRKKREEKEDEEFVKSIKFNNKPSLPNKRVITEEIIEDVDDKQQISISSNKKIKVENNCEAAAVLEPQSSTTGTTSTITNITNVTVVPKSNKNEVWNKSVGVISRKGGLAGLVKVNKKPTLNNNIANNAESKIVETSEVIKIPPRMQTVPVSAIKPPVLSSPDPPSPVPAASGLSLLAGYSDSDSNQESD